jgi:hypothetical protein
MIIHTGMRLNKSMLENLLGAEVAMHASKNGSMDLVGFDRWCRHFTKNKLQQHGQDKHVYLFIDGHSSRCRGMSRWCCR